MTDVEKLLREQLKEELPGGTFDMFVQFLKDNIDGCKTYTATIYEIENGVGAWVHKDTLKGTWMKESTGVYNYIFPFQADLSKVFISPFLNFENQGHRYSNSQLEEITIKCDAWDGGNGIRLETYRNGTLSDGCLSAPFYGIMIEFKYFSNTEKIIS
jgi:hypothetical protein